MKSRFSYIQQGDPVPLGELGRSKTNPDSDYHTYIETCIAGLMKVRQHFLLHFCLDKVPVGHRTDYS